MNFNEQKSKNKKEDNILTNHTKPYMIYNFLHRPTSLQLRTKSTIRIYKYSGASKTGNLGIREVWKTFSD
jgi:hypothetical protein